jgi:hypothetical protein
MAIELLLREQVKNFWGRSACGEIYAVGVSKQDIYDVQSRARYRREPYLPEFARFYEGHGKDVLEIGVGMGADHVEWARLRPRSLTGIDLTGRGIIALYVGPPHGRYSGARCRFIGSQSQTPRDEERPGNKQHRIR